jgi:glycosyltransferase involved in cell wall biosynthesis
MPPKLSVVLPVWNGEKYIAEAVESVLRQTFAHFELLVIDDGSTDATAAILASYDDPRIKIHRLAHGGIVQALNFGVAQSQAEWIARQDADDRSLPERFAMQWQALQEHKNAVLTFTDAALIGEWKSRLGRARFPRTKAFIALRLCYQSPIIHSTVVFRKDAFRQAGGYRPEERHAEDYALWGRMLELGEFVPVPQPLLEFRVHPASVSKHNLETQHSLTTQIASENTRRFMGLEERDARRAFETLVVPPEKRPLREWFWFATHCLPKLRWKSAEVYGWAAWQTVRNVIPLKRTGVSLSSLSA